MQPLDFRWRSLSFIVFFEGGHMGEPTSWGIASPNGEHIIYNILKDIFYFFLGDPINFPDPYTGSDDGSDVIEDGPIEGCRDPAGPDNFT